MSGLKLEPNTKPKQFIYAMLERAGERLPAIDIHDKSMAEILTTPIKQSKRLT